MLSTRNMVLLAGSALVLILVVPACVRSQDAEGEPTFRNFYNCTWAKGDPGEQAQAYLGGCGSEEICPLYRGSEAKLELQFCTYLPCFRLRGRAIARKKRRSVIRLKEVFYDICRVTVQPGSCKNANINYLHTCIINIYFKHTAFFFFFNSVRFCFNTRKLSSKWFRPSSSPGNL
ncbi:unnamed protein product [Ixodes pacificus]